MPFFIPDYDSLPIHHMMLSDNVRTVAYQKAIEANVKPGDIVVDAGSGTGILAMLAARAGARKVYAIEATPIICLARRIARQNGLASPIEFIEGRAEEVDLPDKADCMVSEWLGVFALQENMLPSVASARRRLLKPEGTMLPEAVSLFLALLEDEALHDAKIGRWRRQPYGLDYGEFAASQANDVHADPIAPEALLSSPARIATVDMRVATDAHLNVETSLKAARQGVCHGLAGWFRAEFPEGVALDTAPGQPMTHWRQAFFPVLDPVALNRGDEVAVRFASQPEGALVHFAWEFAVRARGGPVFAGDTRRVRSQDR